MAWTVTNKALTVFGNLRVQILELTADAATQNVTTSLGVIYGFSVGAKSLTTGAPHIYANSSATGVATPGQLGCSGFASGDTLYVTVYGT